MFTVYSNHRADNFPACLVCIHPPRKSILSVSNSGWVAKGLLVQYIHIQYIQEGRRPRTLDLSAITREHRATLPPTPDSARTGGVQTWRVPMLRDLRTGVLYRNPKPHVRSEHAYFPSVVVLDDNELLATVVLGEAFEAPDLRTCLLRSTDASASWRFEGRIYPGTPDRLTSDCSRISRTADGGLVAVMVQDDRSKHPDEGLSNAENLGHVPNALFLLRSRDRGVTWTSPAPIETPLEGPCFELCCPIVPLHDGRWMLPTSTWPDWEGRAPNGWRMAALISSDRGATWPEYADVMVDPEQRVIFWESKIVELPDNRLLAVAWAYDQIAARDLPNQFSLSSDGGWTWTPPCSTGLQGQTLTPLVLPDGRILSLFRGMDEPGLWAVLSRIEGNAWINEGFHPLWGAGTANLTGKSANMVENFIESARNYLKSGQ
jgi:hypothetical protein